MLEPCKPCALLRGHHPAAQPPNTAVRPHQPRRRTRSMPAAVPSSAASSSAPEVVEGMSAVLRRTRAHPLRAVLLDQVRHARLDGPVGMALMALMATIWP